MDHAWILPIIPERCPSLGIINGLETCTGRGANCSPGSKAAGIISEIIAGAKGKFQPAQRVIYETKGGNIHT